MYNSAKAKASSASRKTTKLSNVPGRDAIIPVRLDHLTPAAINDQTYKPIDPKDPATVRLIESIRRTNTVDPLNITLDWVIVSGHRRRVACQVLGITEVPVKILPIRSTDPTFAKYLVDFNAQRVKTVDELIREEVVRTSPDDARLDLLAHRATEQNDSYRRLRGAGLRVIDPALARRRAAISSSKQSMLEAANGVIEQYRDYWPLTLRQIHYRLLTRNVLRNTTTGLQYTNNQQSYKDLSDLLTRARLSELVQWESMHDPTRPPTKWAQWEHVGLYMREQLDKVLTGFKRNLLQSQTAYVELVVEKVAALDIAKRAAGYYHVPVGVGRGYTSTTSLDETADRFFASGKDHFILLILSDLDPEGEDITEKWGALLRDEHGVGNITAVKVAVNPDQIAEYNLSPLPVKGGSSRKGRFVKVHGEDVFELEAFEPDQLQNIIREAIRSVIDLERFAEEQKQESEEARLLIAARKQVCEVLAATIRTCPDGGVE